MIEAIDRAGDPRLAAYAHVGVPAWLRSHGLFVAEGRFVVRRLIEAARYDIASIVLSPAALEGMRDAIAHASCPVYVVPNLVVEALTGIEFHRGCLAIASRPESAHPLQSFAGAKRLLAVERVANPDNIGGLFRVAAAFGAGGVLLDDASGDPFYRKAIRTSMGATLQLPFTRLASWPEDLATLRGGGFAVAALTPDESAVAIADYARSLARDQRVILMLGAEGEGLTSEAFDAADARVRIPIAPGVDSLNVVVAAGIALATMASIGGP